MEPRSRHAYQTLCLILLEICLAPGLEPVARHITIIFSFCLSFFFLSGWHKVQHSFLMGEFLSVMDNIDCQLHRTQDHHGNSTLVFMRLFLERFDSA